MAFDPTPAFAELTRRAEGIFAGSAGREQRLLALCDLLARGVPYYNWVGFYLADPAAGVLRLGPYVGLPTEHVTIPYGLGLCGQVAQSPQTYVAQDVFKEDNYLSCCVDVKAEIIVPILRDGALAAELDIDSHHYSPFTSADRTFLEAMCARAVQAGLF